MLRAAVYAAAGLTVAVLCGILLYILIKGVGHLSPELFALKYNSENCSVLPALVNTLTVTFLALLIAVPLGVFSAVYLVEYAKKGNRFVSLVRITAETLSGIPSIVYGLFGYLLFVTTLNFGYSLLSGALTLSIMILPVTMRTTEEALLGVPDAYREGSFGLGAGKLRTVFHVVLPSAVPGILAGVILATGRIVGETAHCGRDRRADFHNRHRRADSRQHPGLRAHARRASLCTLERGVKHRQGLRHGGGAAGHCGGNQHAFGVRRQKNHERENRWKIKQNST